ncbi:lytic exoenzyme target recognition domain-containing protein [Melissococcus plutonius]|uniref:lytic exoenzyme target recognition domain-containing protein n=4 Tax=Melissococcus plutonius TaxID=33970 RepID=UPI0021E610C3|nr:lytic exoenzyme target recognition domain-containing protein [Melissococcus plutonius]MCV2498198.1 endolysin [Melissococcus plutonius]MCV2506813.1 endolysin [Melissococcus plutonius]MCV2527149.1 endolysin [Melissococcus plutonius]
MALNGIDISSYQSQLQINKVPMDFVVIKATGGKSYVNPHCDKHFQQAKAAGKLIGVYHYAKERGLAGSAKEEAKHFINSIKGYIGKAILVLDWEEDVTNTSWAKVFLDTVYTTTGVKPLIYMSKSVTRQTDWSTVASADYGLWPAQYADNNPTGYQANPWTDNGNTGAFKNIVMFQYSSHGRLSGYNGDLDLDKFYGDRNAWLAYAKVRNKSTSVPPNPTKRRYGYRVDNLQVVNGVWQVRNDYLVPVDFNWTDNGIRPEDLDKINPADGSMHSDQIFKVDDYFAFKPECVLSVDTPVMVSGWQFMKVNLRHTGIVWLSVYSKEYLIYG